MLTTFVVCTPIIFGGYKDVKQAVRKHVDDDDKQKLEKLRVVETTPLLNTYEKAQIFINYYWSNRMLHQSTNTIAIGVLTIFVVCTPIIFQKERFLEIAIWPNRVHV